MEKIFLKNYSECTQLLWVVLVFQREHAVNKKKHCWPALTDSAGRLLCIRDDTHNIWKSCCSVIKHVSSMSYNIWEGKLSDNHVTLAVKLLLQIKQIFLCCCKWASNICRNKMNNTFVFVYFILIQSSGSVSGKTCRNIHQHFADVNIAANLIYNKGRGCTKLDWWTAF